MNVSFRTTIFDASSEIPDDAFHGEDLAKWLKERLAGWDATVELEDGYWAVEAQKDKRNYIFGVLELETNDVNELGPKWIIAIYNERDTHSFRNLFSFKRHPPTAHPEVVSEIVQILRTNGMSDVQVSPLT